MQVFAGFGLYCGGESQPPVQDAHKVRGQALAWHVKLKLLETWIIFGWDAKSI